MKYDYCNEQFEEFMDDTTFVRLCLWTQKLENIDEECLTLQKIIIPKYGVINDILEGASQVFQIDKNDIVLIKKRNVQGVYSCNNLSNNGNDNYFIHGVIQGMILYVEKKNPNSEELLKWQIEFEMQTNRFTIKFNSPKDDFTIPKFENQLVIDVRTSLNDLKQQICERLQENPEQIILKRQGKLGMELKDLTKKIEEVNMVNGSHIFVEYGIPSIEGQFKCNFSLVIKNDLSNDKCFYQFKELFTFAVNGQETPSSLIPKLIDQVKSQFNIDLFCNKIRLRERLNDRLTRIYRENVFDDQSIFDRRCIAIEPLEQDDQVMTKDQHLVYIRLMDPQTLEISDRFEIIISRQQKLKDLAEKIYQINQQIKIENMKGARFLVWNNFDRTDVKDEQFYDMCDDNLSLYNSPFYILNDGVLLIIQDKLIQPKVITKEDKKQNKTDDRIKAVKLSLQPVKQKQETGVKIQIMTKEQELLMEQSKPASQTQKSQNQECETDTPKVEPLF